MMAAKRPYIYTGGGVPLSNASQELHPDMLATPAPTR
jgi:thiamine pyrophosphate-dependent acetolactate synthase large subunit-like protein